MVDTKIPGIVNLHAPSPAFTMNIDSSWIGTQLEQSSRFWSDPRRNFASRPTVIRLQKWRQNEWEPRPLILHSPREDAAVVYSAIWSPHAKHFNVMQTMKAVQALTNSRLKENLACPVRTIWPTSQFLKFFRQCQKIMPHESRYVRTPTHFHKQQRQSTLIAVFLRVAHKTQVHLDRSCQQL